ncbi:hypothetical protein T4B_4743 [Trichinella pseudospiralis]|uniref:Uncharacterized protein n=1 Tax=Trichinella pseudospiralis TaxID=6337 RepID=A0A0V1HVH1_TRIPS|nr:hypothetical protein T4B_4743 [Trichinella pseudospiralis]
MCFMFTRFKRHFVFNAFSFNNLKHALGSLMLVLFVSEKQQLEMQNVAWLEDCFGKLHSLAINPLTLL